MLKSDKLWKILSDCCHMLILFGFKLSNWSKIFERAPTDQTNMVFFLTNQIPTESIFSSFREFSRACHWLHVFPLGSDWFVEIICSNWSDVLVCFDFTTFCWWYIVINLNSCHKINIQCGGKHTWFYLTVKHYFHYFLRNFKSVGKSNNF